VFTREELFAKFSMAGVGSSPAVFDYNKLDWLNGVHLRKLDVRDLANRLIPFLEKDGIVIDTDERREMLVKIVPHISERIKKLNEAAPLVDFFFADIAVPPADMLIGPKMEKHLSLHALRSSTALIESIEPFDDATLEAKLRALCDELQLKPTQLFSIIRNAVTGKSVTPPLFATLAILGRETALERLKRAEAQLQAG
jgi:glutamyl-tRNA synthetase